MLRLLIIFNISDQSNVYLMWLIFRQLSENGPLLTVTSDQELLQVIKSCYK
jgi:hypothetical protein